MPKKLMAVHAIQHKPGNKTVSVSPGETFTAKDDAEAEFFLRTKAARELDPAETKAKTTTAKKPAAKKAAPAPAGDTEKGVSLDSEPGDPGSDTADDTGMLD